MARQSVRSSRSAAVATSHSAASINTNPKGRAVRSCRKRARESPFEDSAVAISDSEDDDVDDMDVDEGIPVAPARKRKRSPSPELRLASDNVDVDSDADPIEPDITDSPASGPSGHVSLHLTVNIPLGHQGPITLQLDPKQLYSTLSTSPSKQDRTSRNQWYHLDARPTGRKRKQTGFLDLPAELRNEIYRMMFVTEKSINFSVPNNFSRSAALLRTCKQVYEEGRSILYSENNFVVERRTQRYGSLWENQWRELGYLNVRKFMKSIGPRNIALLRRLTLVLEDAVPCLNPGMRTNEERRFVHDDDLMSVLRHLGNHSQLKTLSLHFHGRRRVDRSDDRFLDYMKRIKADDAEIIDWPAISTYPRPSKQDASVKVMLLKHCTRRKKKFPKAKTT